MVDWGELTLFLYITARMSGFVLFNPLLGRRNIPGIFRGGLILTLSVFVFSVTEQKVDVPGETIRLRHSNPFGAGAGVHPRYGDEFFLLHRPACRSNG